MDPRDTDQDLRDIAGDIIRGVKREYDTTTGLVVVNGFHEQPISEVPNAHFYGFRSNSPVDTEVVIAYTEGGVIVVGERGNLPSGVSEPAAGATKLYNAQGCEVHLDEDGNVVHVPKSGKFVLLGSASASHKIALGDTTDQHLGNIAEKYDAHTHTAPSGGGTTTTPSLIVGSLSSVQASKVKAE
jgi:hypothetical protein